MPAVGNRFGHRGSSSHDASVEALQVEARTLQSQVSGLVQNPLNGILPMLVPLIGIIIRSLKKPAAEHAAKDHA